MALSAVRQLTLAFIRGEVKAEDVVKQVRNPQQVEKSPEQVTLETSEDFQSQETVENTWADVDRYWDMLTPEQQDELTKARLRKFGE